jgi:hypothetical protein
MATRIPKITWSGSFASTLNIGYALDDYAAYSTYREGSEFAQATSGIEDAWVIGIDYMLEGTIRWIPTTNTTNPTQTGWDGTTGVRAFLDWARQKNVFRFYPDKDSATYITSYLVNPLDGKHTLEPDGTRQFRIVIRNVTTAYDGY